MDSESRFWYNIIKGIDWRKSNMYKNVLISIAHGGNSNHLFKVGLELALRYNASITLCHIKNLQYILPNYANGSMYMPQDVFYFETDTGMEDILNKYKEIALKKGIKKVDVVITASSTPGLAISDVVADGYGCDLIVCGASNSKGVFKIFGNTTNEIVKNAKCDVLVVKPKVEEKK